MCAKFLCGGDGVEEESVQGFMQKGQKESKKKLEMSGSTGSLCVCVVEGGEKVNGEVVCAV